MPKKRLRMGTGKRETRERAQARLSAFCCAGDGGGEEGGGREELRKRVVRRVDSKAGSRAAGSRWVVRR